jgi:bifunctional aspartokinase / homoserine dehydrogenase 1
MIVLKFGGSSVAAPEQIKSVIEIIKNHSATETVLVIVSAFGKTTDRLHKALSLAEKKDENYKSELQWVLDKIEENTRDITLSESARAQLNTWTEELVKMLEGVYLTREAGPRITDKVLGSGELFSSLILSEWLKTISLEADWRNSYDYIKVEGSLGEKKILSQVSYH